MHTTPHQGCNIFYLHVAKAGEAVIISQFVTKYAVAANGPYGIQWSLVRLSGTFQIH